MTDAAFWWRVARLLVAGLIALLAALTQCGRGRHELTTFVGSGYGVHIVGFIDR